MSHGRLPSVISPAAPTPAPIAVRAPTSVPARTPVTIERGRPPARPAVSALAAQPDLISRAAAERAASDGEPWTLLALLRGLRAAVPLPREACCGADDEARRPSSPALKPAPRFAPRTLESHGPGGRR